jgi:hypothetical protein
MYLFSVPGRGSSLQEDEQLQRGWLLFMTAEERSHRIALGFFERAKSATWNDINGVESFVKRKQEEQSCLAGS